MRRIVDLHTFDSLITQVLTEWDCPAINSLRKEDLVPKDKCVLVRNVCINCREAK